MIGWLIFLIGAAVAVIVIYAQWLDRRVRRDRTNLRYLTGARPWWGRR